jgi:CBS domain-containing protein
MSDEQPESTATDATSTKQPLLVRDLMTVGVPTCKPDSLVAEIAGFLLEHDVEAMCVLDEEGQAIGIVGSEELVGVYGREGARDLKAEDVMTEGLPELDAETPLTVGAQIMGDRGTRIAYIMHNSAGISYPAAYISYRHVLRHLAARDGAIPKGPAAPRKSPLETFIERRDEARKKAAGPR